MRLLREAQTSFARGVNDSSAPDEYYPDQAQVMINGRPSFQGNAAERMAGQYLLASRQNWTSLAASTCYGAIEFYTAAGVQQIVAAFDDAMYFSTDGGATFTQITGATSLREDYWSFVIYREGSSNVLCSANGGTNSYQYDGTTWATISNIPSGTNLLAVLGDRLVAAGGSGVTVEASAVGNIDDGYGGGTGGWTVKATTHDGDTALTGLFTLGSMLLVFKRKSVGFIEGFGYQTLQVETGARGLSRSVGCVARRSIAPCGDQAVMWLSERGFEYYPLGGLIQLASAHQQRFVGRISKEAIRQYPGLPSAMWVPGKQEYWCAVPVANGVTTALSSTRNTWTYIFRPPAGDRPPAAYMRYPTDSGDSTLTIGTDRMLGFDQGDLTNYMAVVDERGMLDVAKLPDPGLWVHVDGSGMLDVGANANHPSSLFTADAGNRPAHPFAGTHDNSIVELERDGSELEVSIVENGAFATDTVWLKGSNWRISGGVADLSSAGLGTPTGVLSQALPLVAGESYVVTYTISNRTQGAFRVALGGANGTSRPTNGTFTETIVAGAGSTIQFETYGLVGETLCDGDIDGVQVLTLGDPVRNRCILRTRPFTGGDEFTRKKAKRVEVLATQPNAHTADVYALADLTYGTKHEIALTAADAGQEKKARVSGRGRVQQAEVHVGQPCRIDGISLVIQPMGDAL